MILHYQANLIQSERLILKKGTVDDYLTVYEYDGKILILLLHLPDSEDWKMFLDTTLNIDEEIIASSIDRFKNKCNLAAIPELASEAWQERCSFPIGMDAEGIFFELE